MRSYTCIALALVLIPLEAGAEPSSEPWTARTSVEVRRFSGTGVSIANRDMAEASPDGRHFYVLHWEGNVETDRRNFTLRIYSTEQVAAAVAANAADPPPARMITMRHQRRPAISQVSWVDNHTITFLGYGDAEMAQAYRYDLSNNRLERITSTRCGLSGADLPKTNAIGMASFSTAGPGTIYLCFEADSVPVRYPLHTMTRTMIQSANLGMTHRYVRAYSVFGDGPELALGLTLNTSLSPDGRHAIYVRTLERAPTSWSAFDGGRALVLDPEEGPDGQARTIAQFRLVDLVRRTEGPLFDAPSGTATQIGQESLVPEAAYWSSDGRSVVLVNTALPSSQEVQPNMAYIVSYDVLRGREAILEPLRSPDGTRVKQVEWRIPGAELLVRHERNGEPIYSTVYRYVAGAWRPRRVSAVRAAPATAEQRLPDGLAIVGREGPNEPQHVVAISHGREIELIGPDPRMANVVIAEQIPFNLTDSRGDLRRNAMVLPRDIPNGVRVPLVIDIGSRGGDLDLFQPDGHSDTAHATQALVAQGMAVLKIDDPFWILRGNDWVRVRDGHRYFAREWLDQVVAAAAQRFPIDPNRVGLLGFSATGFITRYAITHSNNTRISAAIIADSFAHSYFDSLVGGAGAWGLESQDRHAGPNLDYSNTPFFEAESARQDWLRREVSFNAGRVRTPTLFVDNDQYIWNALETIGAFNLARRPFDYLFLPDGEHILLAPRQREASLNATVDWFNFWLQGRETPRSEDPGRYDRWRRIRDRWQAQQAWEARGYPVSSRPHDPAVINRAGYRYLYENRDIPAALKEFQINLESNPGAAWAHDSLAEGYMQAGDVGRAAENYAAAAQLDSTQYGHDAAIASELRTNPSSLSKYQQQFREAWQSARAD